MSPVADVAPAGGPRQRWSILKSQFVLSPWPAVLLGLLCFANSTRNGFTYDDQPLVLDNPRVRSLTDFRAVWMSDWWKVSEDTSELSTRRDRLYRPLTLFTFALDYAVHECRPAGYHAVNVVLHTGVCFLLWYFARRLTGDRAVATVAAVLFAIHPVHGEAVANVVGRAELLAALFLLGGVLLLRPRYGVLSVPRIVASAVAFLAALLSKETAVCYPVVALLLLHATPGEKRPRGWLRQAACLLLPLLVYFPLRYAALDGHLFRTAPADVLMNPLVTATPAQRLPGALTVLGQYVRLLVVPDRLSADYGLAVVDAEQGFTVFTLVGLLAVGGAGLALAGFARPGVLWRRLAVLAAMTLASYALISNTVLLIGVSLAERLMYWPSVPILIVVAVGIVEFWRRQCVAGRPLESRAGLLGVLGTLVVLALGLRTIIRNTDWVDNLTLFERDVRTYPQGACLNKGYATEVLRFADGLQLSTGKEPLWKRAEKHLTAALQVYPGYVEALVLRGKVRAQLGDMDGARRDLESTLLLAPESSEARETLAKLAGGGQETEQRLAALQADVAQHPDDPARHLVLGQALLECGRYPEARKQTELALALAPDNVDGLRQLGKILALTSEKDRAVEIFRRVLALAPDDWQAHANLTTLLAESDAPAALRHAQQACKLQPGDLRNQVNLAEAYALNRRLPEALDLYRRIEQQLDHNDPVWRVVADRIARLERQQ